MSYSPAFDDMAVILGMYVLLGILAFIVATVAETLLLQVMLKKPFSRLITISFEMNIVSAIIGFVLAYYVDLGITDTKPLLMFVTWIIVEWAYLSGLEANIKPTNVWVIAIIINVITYGFLAIGLGFLGFR
jgi:hypothetical protein